MIGDYLRVYGLDSGGGAVAYGMTGLVQAREWRLQRRSMSRAHVVEYHADDLGGVGDTERGGHEVDPDSCSRRDGRVRALAGGDERVAPG